MLAVTANLTLVHYGHRHVCVPHKFRVDKKHIDVCEHIKQDLPTTAFNSELLATKLYSFPEERLRLMH